MADAKFNIKFEIKPEDLERLASALEVSRRAQAGANDRRRAVERALDNLVFQRMTREQQIEAARARLRAELLREGAAAALAAAERAFK